MEKYITLINTRRIFILLVLTITLSSVFSQNVIGISPIHTFLQENADSTLILTYSTVLLKPSKYLIISKKTDTITMYSYESAFDNRINMPKNIKRILHKKSLEMINTPVDINHFFSAKYISNEEARVFWKKLSFFKPWKLSDDSIDGEGCPEKKNKVYDGQDLILFLITKDNIKRLSFYAPWTFENDLCPGRVSRKNILEIEKIFTSYFGN